MSDCCKTSPPAIPSVVDMTSSTLSPADLYATRAARVGTLLPTADPDAATPCEGWSVRDVVEHMLSTQRDFLTGHGHDVPDVSGEADLARAWATHTAAVGDLLARPGVATQAYDGFFGPTTIGETIADFYGVDLVVHGWDVARALGRDWPIDDDEADAVAETARGWGPALRMDGICGPEVPVAADASPQERLLGLLGRDPAWAPR